MHRVLLGGTEVPLPSDYDGFEQRVERDFERRFIRVRYPNKLTFKGDLGYDILRTAFVEDVCGIVPIEVVEDCGGTRYQIVKGEIILADATFNLNRCIVEAAVQDDTIGSRIANNFRIPISPSSPKSKNATDITAVVPLEIEVFDPSDPEPDYLTPVRFMYDWMDSMEHAIAYASDGNVGVRSDWYDSLSFDERIALCGGLQLRTGSTADDAKRITYTFEKVWLEIAKRYNLWMAVTRDDLGAPQVRIEHEDTMFPDVMAMELPWQMDLKQSVDGDRQYSSVVVGDEKGIPNVDAIDESLPFLVLQGFSEERFHFSGVCNRDVVLELSGQWIADTNVIERVVVLAPTDNEYDKDIFIVQYNSYNSRAVKGSYLNPGVNPYLYNEQLLNLNILNRYDLPSDVGQYYDSQGAIFRASHPALYSATSQLVQPGAVGTTFEYLFPAGYIVFPDDVTPPNEDPSGLWDGMDRYTSPAQGYYEFGWHFPWFSVHVTPMGHAPAQAFVIAEIQRFDSGNTFISGVRATSDPRTSNGTSVFTGSLGVVMNAGDYVTITFIRLVRRIGPGSATVSITPVAGAAVFTTFVAAGGGMITSVDPLSPRSIRYEFERIVPVSQWQPLINDPRLGVAVSPTDGEMRYSHPIEGTRKVLSGKTSFTLVATRRQPL